MRAGGRCCGEVVCYLLKDSLNILVGCGAGFGAEGGDVSEDLAVGENGTLDL